MTPWEDIETHSTSKNTLKQNDKRTHNVRHAKHVKKRNDKRKTQK